MRFAPEYVTHVLTDNFEDAKTYLLAPLMSIHYAHLVMLTEQGIVSRDDARVLRTALDAIRPDEVKGIVFDGTYEDLFFYLEHLIAESAGEQTAGRLHTARSRNDIAMTTYRMWQRHSIAALARGTLTLRQALLDLAAQHVHTIYGAHTHTQPAQVMTIAHYLLSIVEEMERHGTRLAAAYSSTNVNPLGACAITGTGFPIDRFRTAALLGFDGPTGNTYGSIATVDYLIEGVSAAANTVVGLGRVVQDLLLWGTMEFGYLRLSDGFVQSSSIMPQKRNPDFAELVRGRSARAVGNWVTFMSTMKGLPLGYNRDMQDDKPPLFDSVELCFNSMTLCREMLETATWNLPRLKQMATAGFSSATAVAEALVLEGIPFRQAHEAVGRLVLYCEQQGKSLADLDQHDATTLSLPLAALEAASLERALTAKISYGSPGPEPMKIQLSEAKLLTQNKI